ncbi:MAG: TolC family protein [Planctomycetes bacterium]|nr:TolC family protein [Planctomycetota bacterium]
MGRNTRLGLVPFGLCLLAGCGTLEPARAEPQTTPPTSQNDNDSKIGAKPTLLPPVPVEVELMPIDLPTALRLANASNPFIAIARERVQQAYFRQRQSEVQWLPDLVAGPSYLRHDGLVQNAAGLVFPTSKWNFFAGGGAALRLHLSDALFGPLVTRRLTEAQASESRTVTHDVQLEVALAYLDLLHVHGRLAINADTLIHAKEMLKFAESAQELGTGKTPADAPRARTEVYQRTVERRDLEGAAGQASARLAQLLLLRPSVDLLPAETAIVPIQLVDAESSLDDMVTIGLQNRPELAQGRSLVDAAYLRWRQAKTDRFIPRVEVSYLSGTFGGGLNTDTLRFGARGDGSVAAVWELHNFGAGDVARSRERFSYLQEANLHVVETQARIGADVVAAAKLVRAHKRTLEEAQKGVKQAQEAWRILRVSSFGMGGREKRYDPLEPLIAEQQLHTARNQYLFEVIGYNRAQFRLYTAMGSPALCALPSAQTLVVETPVLPQIPAKKDER